MKTKAIFQIFVMIFSIFSIITFSQDVNAVNGCCEKTKTGGICEVVSDINEECAEGNKAPSDCASTSFCKPGCLLDFKDGYCVANTPKGEVTSRLSDPNSKVAFNDNINCDIPQCKKGCCMIGTEASLTTEIKCKESVKGFPGLQPNFKPEITDELQCLNSARSQEKGCCVVSYDNCKYTTRGECNLATAADKASAGFFKDTACTDTSKLNCKSTTQYIKGCLEGSESVYYFDSDGNIDIKASESAQSQNKEKGLGGVKNNKEGVAEYCDYTNGSICGKNIEGDYQCVSIDCVKQKNPESGKKYSFELNDYIGTNILIKDEVNGVRNGESWCLYDIKEQAYFGDDSVGGRDPVGSRYYRSVCINGKEFVEPCKDYRKEFCIDGTIKLQTEKKYTEARCVENRADECTTKCNIANAYNMNQENYKEALNKDQKCCSDITKRDCSWTGNKCVPKVSPGFKFWNNEGIDICAKASMECPVVFVCNGWNAMTNTCGGSKNEAMQYIIPATGAIASGAIAAIMSGGALAPAGIAFALSAIDLGVKQAQPNTGWKILSGSECLSENYIQAANNYCRSVGDCGADTNYKDLDKYTYGGFDNTKNLNGDYFKNNNIKGMREFENDPGKLDIPDWNKGSSFLNFAHAEKQRGGFIDRLFGSEGERFWWTQISGFTTSGILGGIAGIGISRVGGILLGAGATPLGILPSYGAEYALSKTVRYAGLEQAKKDVAQQGLKNVKYEDRLYKKTTEGWFEGSTKVADETIIKNLESEVSIWGEGGVTVGIMTAVNAAMWVDMIYEIGNLLGEQVKVEKIKTTCGLWEAPKVESKDDCEKCNPNYKNYLKNEVVDKVSALKTCSEYTCRALGDSCELINQGTGNELCVSKQKTDVNSPEIIPWNEIFSKDYKAVPLPELDNNIKRGFKVQYNDKDEVKYYQTFTIGIKSEQEPSKCKMSLTGSKRYKDMGDYYFGGNLFSYFHSQQITFPNTPTITQPGTVGASSQKENEYNIYLRCEDANGNVNEKDYVIRVKVEKTPDTTPPIINRASVDSGSYFVSAATVYPIQLYVNEPGSCKWGIKDLEYDKMNNGMICNSDMNDITQSYICTSNLGLVANAENKFYFRCEDKFNNKNDKSFELTLKPSDPLLIDKIMIDKTGIVNNEVYGTLDTTGKIKVPIRIETSKGAQKDGNSSCGYSIITWSNAPSAGSFVDFTEPLAEITTNAPVHKIDISVVASDSGIKYIAYIQCKDIAGNLANKIGGAVANVTFTAKKATAPSLTSVYKKDAFLTIITDKNSNCYYATDKILIDYKDGTSMPEDNSKIHLATYNEGRTYSIICVDAVDNTRKSSFTVYT